MTTLTNLRLGILWGTRWQDVFRLANRLIQAGVPVYRVEPDPAGAETPWPVGTFLAASHPLETLGLDWSTTPPGLEAAAVWPFLTALGAGLEAEVKLVPPLRVSGYPLTRISRPRIGVYGGGGAPFNHLALFATLGFETDFINDAEIRAGGLCAFDVLVFPGGGTQAMMGQLCPLGAEGVTAVARFVRAGGMYIGCCAGSFNAAIVADAFLKLCPHQETLRLVNARVWNDGDQWIGLASPGVGVIEVANADPTHPVMWNLPERFQVTHYNGPMFEPLVKPQVDGASLTRGLARFAGRTDQFTPAERFLETGGAQSGPFLFDRGVEAGTFAAIAGEAGLGRVVLFGSHPEFGSNLLLDDWDIAGQMLGNAILWQSAHQPFHRTIADRPSVAGVGSTIPLTRPHEAALSRLAARLEMLLPAVEELQGLPTGDQRWLKPDYSLSVLGMSPAEIWEQGLGALRGGIRQCIALCGRVGELSAILSAAPVALSAETLASVDAVLAYRRDPSWHQDVGFNGLFELVCQIQLQLNGALANTRKDVPEPVGHPYQHFDVNPYHLAVGSYLAALGLVAGAKQLLLRTEAELTDAIALLPVRQ